MGWNATVVEKLTALADLNDLMEALLDYEGTSAATYLSDIDVGIQDVLDSMTSGGDLYDMLDVHLYDDDEGASAAELLGDIKEAVEAIKDQTDKFQFNGSDYLKVETYAG